MEKPLKYYGFLYYWLESVGGGWVRKNIRTLHQATLHISRAGGRGAPPHPNHPNHPNHPWQASIIPLDQLRSEWVTSSSENLNIF